jgi:hypothetical protein
MLHMASDNSNVPNASTTIEYVLVHLDGILGLLQDSQIVDLVWPLVQLETLREKAREIYVAPTMEAVEWLEIEFHNLVDSDPRLRTAFFAAYYNEIIKSCDVKRYYFSELSRKRPLTAEELDELQSLEKAVAQVKKDQEEELARLESDGGEAE